MKLADGKTPTGVEDINALAANRSQIPAIKYQYISQPLN
jgi:hypothetical protein